MPPPKPKPDYSAPADAPYIAEEVVVKTPAGHTLAGTLTLPKGASRTKPVSAIVTVTGSGPQDRDENIGLQGFRPLVNSRMRWDAAGSRCCAWTTVGLGHQVARSRARPAPTSPRTCAPASRIPARGPRSAPTASRAWPQRGCHHRSDGGRKGTQVARHRAARRHRAAGRTALHFQLKNQIEHNTTLTPEKRDSQIAEIPKRIDAMMANDPWMKFFLTYDPAPTMRRVKTPADPHRLARPAGGARAGCSTGGRV